MSNQVDHFFEQQDFSTKLSIAEISGDELTEIAVEALYRAFELLRDEVSSDTVH